MVNTSPSYPSACCIVQNHRQDFLLFPDLRLTPPTPSPPTPTPAPAATGGREDADNCPTCSDEVLQTGDRLLAQSFKKYLFTYYNSWLPEAPRDGHLGRCQLLKMPEIPPPLSLPPDVCLSITKMPLGQPAGQHL